jgi:hypothetical protein
MKLTTVKLFIDKDVLMKDLDVILMSLRNSNLLKVAYMGYPANNAGSALLAHAYGRTSLLPPVEGIEILSEEEVRKQGIGLFAVEVMDKNNSPAKTKSRLKEFVAASDKYITPIEYEGSSRYSDFLAYYDMVFATIAELRNELALENYQAKYDELSRIEQDKIRKRYPVTAFLKNVDEQPGGFGKK